MNEPNAGAMDSEDLPIEGDARRDDSEGLPEPEESKPYPDGPQETPAAPERKPLR